jgi:glutathione S-transferase
MKLYYGRGTCSLGCHIALRESHQPVELVRFDLPTHKLEDGRPIEDVNPKGYVPVLELDDGERLTEAAVVLQYIADRPGANLAPPIGTMERYRMQEWLNFVATELHKPFWPFFHLEAAAEKPTVEPRLRKALGYVEKSLGGRPSLLPFGLTVADIYLFNIVNWIRPAGLDVSVWPGLQAFRKQMLERPAVQAAMSFEQILSSRPKSAAS